MHKKMAMYLRNKKSRNGNGVKKIKLFATELKSIKVQFGAFAMS